MKKMIRSIAVLAAALSVGLTGCVNDANEGNNTGKQTGGEKTSIQLRVLTSGSMTRAAGDDVRDAEGLEDVLADAVHVIVYKASGEFEHFSTQTLVDDDGAKKTGAIDITTGDKYFYVISDPGVVFDGLLDEDYAIQILESVSRTEFEKEILYSQDPSRMSRADYESQLAKINDDEYNGFLNMTLWGVKQTITASTETIDAEIGRVTAKVILNEKPVGFTSKLAGAWSDFKFTVGSVAAKVGMVGQYEGTIAPPKAGHGKVTSYVHDAPKGAPYYGDYSKEYANMKAPYTTTNKNCFYINENTTSKQDVDGTVNDAGKLYYGNTTYVLFAATYTPADTEWHNYLNASQAGDIYKHSDGKSFYTAKVDGQTLVFGQSPVSTMEGLDESSIRLYENGVNYFHFPIRDRKETALENQCRVLRNHWYDITINSIDRFGNNDTTVTPSEPVDEEIELDVLIKVLKWASVSQGENL